MGEISAGLAERAKIIHDTCSRSATPFPVSTSSRRAPRSARSSTLEDSVRQILNLLATAVKRRSPSSFGQAGSWQIRPRSNNSGQSCGSTKGKG
jgi:hypothetical protein